MFKQNKAQVSFIYVWIFLQTKIKKCNDTTWLVVSQHTQQQIFQVLFAFSVSNYMSCPSSSLKSIMSNKIKSISIYTTCCRRPPRCCCCSFVFNFYNVYNCHKLNDDEDEQRVLPNNMTSIIFLNTNITNT